MSIEPTHPPSDRLAEQYRQSGLWLPPSTAAERHERLAAGGSRPGVVDHRDSWTYTDLSNATQALYEALEKAGVRAGDAVLVVAPLRNAAVAGYLATIYQGAVAVLLDRRCGPSDVANACRVTRPAVACAFRADADRLGLRAHCTVVELDEIPTTPTRAKIRQNLLDPDVPALVVFTSGTTSTPKGVIHSLNSLRCGVANMAAALKFTGDDAFFLPSPLASITGVLQIETALQAHGRILLEERFTPASSLDDLCRHGATVYGGAPIVAEELFKEADRRNRGELPLRCIALGGSMITPGVLDGARRFGIDPVRVYGSSEVPFSTATGLGADAVLADDGAPMAGVEISLRQADSAGELMIRGPHQFHGYLDPAHNLDAFCGEWVRTGDRAEIAGGRVRITGRLKDIAIRKGMKISLAEVDVAASELGDCGAYALPDDHTGERVVLAVHACGNTPVTYQHVAEHLTAAGLARWKLPEQIVVWDDALPRTETGKVVRSRLAELGNQQRTLVAPRLAHDNSADQEAN